MVERALIEQLDLAVQALLDDAAGAPPADSQVAALVQVAAELRHLPRAAFRARLASDLKRRSEMTSPAEAESKKQVNFRPGFRTVTPYLAVREAEALIDFVKEAFDAEELGRSGPGSEGGLHSEVRVGDSILMIGGGKNWRGTPCLSALHLYVPDADAVYQRALEAGAASMYPPTDMDYGDREAGVKDLYGNQWFIATHQATGHAPAGLHSITPGLRAQGAEALADFLKRAFGAVEDAVYRSPEGTIVHAKMRIGTSIVELGEAHGQWQPLPSMFYLYVEDVDAWYRRAVAAGAQSVSEPADQPYGDRVGAVRDDYGNLWYMGTPAG